MKLRFAELAEYTSVSQSGNFNILGIFDRIFAQRFPTSHSLQLVLRFEFSAVEADQESKCTILLQDEDGKRIFNIQGGIKTPSIKSPGDIPVANTVMDLKSIPFPHPGSYEFVIWIEDQEVAHVPLKLIRIKPDS